MRMIWGCEFFIRRSMNHWQSFSMHKKKIIWCKMHSIEWKIQMKWNGINAFELNNSKKNHFLSKVCETKIRLDNDKNNSKSKPKLVHIIFWDHQLQIFILLTWTFRIRQTWTICYYSIEIHRESFETFLGKKSSSTNNREKVKVKDKKYLKTGEFEHSVARNGYRGEKDLSLIRWAMSIHNGKKTCFNSANKWIFMKYHRHNIYERHIRIIWALIDFKG